jgi:hypothetical protein
MCPKLTGFKRSSRASHWKGESMLPINLPRRRLLKIAIAGAAGLGAVGGSVAWVLSPGGDTDEVFETGLGRFLVFDDKHARLVLAFAEAALPQGDGFPSPREARVVERMDEELYFVDASIRADLKTAINVLDLLPLFYGRLSTFAKLEVKERRAFLKETQATRSDTVRTVINALRMLTYMMYYGDASSWPAIGYDGPFGGMEPIIGEQRQYYAERIRKGTGGGS